MPSAGPKRSDVMLLLDSLTRLGRSSNLMQTGGGRTLSGGVDSRALEWPRRIFGAARQSEEAGSITIVATALVDTNSRMDDYIYEDFKGTGNCEIVLRREIAESRIFPAIDVKTSGTRNEEIILGDRLPQHHKLRRILYDIPPVDAMKALLRLGRELHKQRGTARVACCVEGSDRKCHVGNGRRPVPSSADRNGTAAVPLRGTGIARCHPPYNG